MLVEKKTHTEFKLTIGAAEAYFIKGSAQNCPEGMGRELDQARANLWKALPDLTELERIMAEERASK
jgi:hypothetical protein